MILDCRVGCAPGNDENINGGHLGRHFRFRLEAAYSAAIFEVGAALRTFSSTWLSKLTKFLRNISRRCFAVAANSDFDAQVFTGSRMCGSTPGTETGTARPK